MSFICIDVNLQVNDVGVDVNLEVDGVGIGIDDNVDAIGVDVNVRSIRFDDVFTFAMSGPWQWPKCYSAVTA